MKNIIKGIKTHQFPFSFKGSIHHWLAVVGCAFLINSTALAQQLDSLGEPKTDFKHTVDQIPIINTTTLYDLMRVFDTSIGKVKVFIPVEAKVNGYWKKIGETGNANPDSSGTVSMGNYTEKSSSTTHSVMTSASVGVEVEVGAIFARASASLELSVAYEHNWSSGVAEGNTSDVTMEKLGGKVLQIWQPILETTYTYKGSLSDLKRLTKKALHDQTNSNIDIDKILAEAVAEVQANFYYHQLEDGLKTVDPQWVYHPTYYPHPEAELPSANIAPTTSANTASSPSTQAINARLAASAAARTNAIREAKNKSYQNQRSLVEQLNKKRSDLAYKYQKRLSSASSSEKVKILEQYQKELAKLGLSTKSQIGGFFGLIPLQFHLYIWIVVGLMGIVGLIMIKKGKFKWKLLGSIGVLLAIAMVILRFS